MKSKDVAALTIIVVIFFILYGIIYIINTQSNSNISDELDRTITVYDNTGNKLAEYDGKVDIDPESTSGKVMFDLDGKRTIIYGGITIVQEK